MRVETQESINAWADATFGAVRSSGWERVFQKFLAEVVELRDALRRRLCVPAAEELADCAILLYRLAAIRKIDLDAEIDAKMAVNRMRVWDTKGDGVGQRRAG